MKTDIIEQIFGPHGAPSTKPARKLTLRHIDNGFYRVPANRVRSLTIDGELPRHGYEKRALPAAALNAKLTLEFWNYRLGGKWETRKPIGDGAQCWLKRTQVNRETVWALHVWESV